MFVRKPYGYAIVPVREIGGVPDIEPMREVIEGVDNDRADLVFIHGIDRPDREGDVLDIGATVRVVGDPSDVDCAFDLRERIGVRWIGYIDHMFGALGGTIEGDHGQDRWDQHQ